MKELFLILPIVGLLFLGYFSTQSVLAQDLGGGVDYPGDWYVGEGLKKGDQFSYELCHVDYKECAEFRMDFWVEGDITVGSENKWLVQAVVYDGNKIVKGNMELGKVAPEPTGGSSELGPYRSAFKSSIVWLSAFATSYGGEGGEGPKEFSMPSWGKIGNIGGQQVRPVEVTNVGVPAGVFESVVVSWKTGGATSKIWVLDEFPFPVKADTFTHVAEGIPPREYQFELLDYKENVSQNPFSGIVSTSEQQQATGCPKNYDLVSVKKPTKNFSYQLDIKYGPENPSKGCDIEWIINFKSKYDDTEFLNQVQYDILVVDDNLSPLRSIAQDEGRNFLYSPSGQVRTFTTVNENPGNANYVIWIYGLSPENIVPSGAPDWLEIDIPISGSSSVITPPPPPPPPTTNVPSWIKTTAGFWVDGFSSDGEFVNAIEFLINEGVIVIPPTASGSGSGALIPAWIKTTTEFWVDGFTSDKEFVTAIQWLIENGIMKIA